jgi:hypothetical protein
MYESEAEVPRDRAVLALAQTAPDGNIWLTILDAKSGEVVTASSGPYTDKQHFLDATRRLPIGRLSTEALHERARIYGQAATDPFFIR